LLLYNKKGGNYPKDKLNPSINRGVFYLKRRINMSLTVDTRSVKNHKTICYKEKTKEGYLYADATYYLAWCSMAIGIGKITEKNYTEVYLRHKFFQLLNKLDCTVTLQEVRDHIGLETNVSFETRGKWKNRIVESHMRTLAYNIREELDNLK
jgi:5-enolpyruvylshikimate-3-phosphate synthase